MYKCIDENNNWYYEFDGDFDQYLLNVGVSADHIEKMKSKILENDRSEYYNKFENSTAEIKLVPLEKVIGTCRCSVGKSVYENVRRMAHGDREPHRFIKCFDFLNSMTLENLRASYESLYYPVHMIYYVEDDAYYLYNDGNHRTLTAMLLGASHIRAKVIIAHCDEEKKKRYFACQDFYKKYSIYKILAFNLYEYHIIFRDNGMKYAVRGFEQLDSEKSCFEVIERLSKEIDKDIYYRKYLCHLPKVLRKIALIFIDEKLQKRLLCYPDIAEVNHIPENYYTQSNVVTLYNKVHTYVKIPRPFYYNHTIPYV